MESAFAKPRLATLLDHFSAIEDPRVSWRVVHPLPEVLLLVVCGSIASCDDFDDIVAWGEAHLDFLRRFLPFEHGVPCGRWLNMLMNRIDPDLFSACFMSWACTLRDDAPDLIALDGKTSRRSHDRSAGKAALHLVSAFATSEKLVLGQEAVSDKSNETTAIPALLERLAQAGALEGALVTIDAIACNPKIAGDIVTHQADYLLAVKQNQPTLHGEIKDFFDTPSEGLIDSYVENDKGHGRIEQRRCEVSHTVDWITGTRRFPGEHRFPEVAAIIKVETRVEHKAHCTHDCRYYIASRTLTAEQAARAVRAHWQIENALHWVLDVTFKEDLARVRKGHGAQNMAIVRHFALNIVRKAKDKKSIKLRRKIAGWDTKYLEKLLTQ